MVKQRRKHIQLSQGSHCISDCTTLLHPTLPVPLQVDASEDAIGGVLLQNDRPVRLTSQTLNNTDK